MTAKRKDNGDLEEVKVGPMTFSYRTILMLLVASATPFGQPILKAFGIQTVAEPVKEAQAKVGEIAQKMDKMQADIDDLKVVGASLEQKVTKVDYRLTGFQVDFDKYRTTHP